ncbi:MAG: NHL repeat-containing protein [Candidatus Cybelea sp.]
MQIFRNVATIAISLLLFAGCGGNNGGTFPLEADHATRSSGPASLYVANEREGAGEDSVQVFPVGSQKRSRTITDGVSTPDALAFDGSGNLYVANYGNATVTVYAPGSTTVSETISTGISTPVALAVGGSNNLYVVNHGTNSSADPGSVTVYRPDGTLLQTITNGINEPVAETLDPSGNLYVANGTWSHRRYIIAIYSPGAKRPFREVYRNVYGPSAVALDSSQDLYVANFDGGTVTVYPPGKGKVLRTLSNSVSAPIALAFDHGDNLYVLDSPPFSEDVSVYEAGTARVLRVISKHIRNAAALALDAADNLYVPSIHLNGEGYVTVYAANTKKVLRQLSMGPLSSFPSALAFGP